MTYYFSHGKMVIDHTEIDEQLRGQHVGEMLVDRGVEFAKEKQLKILPACPYVKALFEKNNKYDDIWK
jgi:predicted GNAT family acetyltransferase